MPTAIALDLSTAFTDRNAVGVRRALRRMLEARNREDRIEGFHHPLGFRRLAMGADAVGLRYFLHHWRRDDRCTQEPDWQTHRHVWDLESFVVAGSLRDQDFRPVDGTGRQLPVYHADVMDDRSTLLRTDEALLLGPPRTTLLQAGDFYRVDIGSFHATHVPMTEECVTLVRVGPRLRPFSQVLGEDDGEEFVSFSRDRMTTGEVTELVDYVLGLLAEEQG